MEHMNKILVIDDDKELCQLLVEFLQPEGFTVHTMHEPHSGLKTALTGDYCLVVLDVMLPGMTGLELLRHLRTSSQVPVLMLTARGEDIDRIIGLEMGADDYLPKPFNPRELVARINAIRRRSNINHQQSSAQQKRLVYDDIVVDLRSRTVKQGGQTIKVTAVEFSLLYELVQQAGQVLSRGELTQKVLHRALDSFDRSIDVHVSSLRKKLGHQIDGRERIKTVRSVGYLYTQAQQEE